MMNLIVLRLFYDDFLIFGSRVITTTFIPTMVQMIIRHTDQDMHEEIQI